MEFKAQKLDLDLDLTTLSGDKVYLKPKIIMNGTNCMNVMKEWTLLEDKYKQENNIYAKPGLLFEELSVIYNKPKEWWPENLPLGLINEILGYVAETMGSLRKKPVSST